MRAFVNLFIYVMENPHLPSVQSDLALLDIAAGYFGQMEFVTSSEVSCSFGRDIAALARSVVDNARIATLKHPVQVPQDIELSDFMAPDVVS
jgi:hypothetical protein